MDLTPFHLTVKWPVSAAGLPEAMLNLHAETAAELEEQLAAALAILEGQLGRLTGTNTGGPRESRPLPFEDEPIGLPTSAGIPNAAPRCPTHDRPMEWSRFDYWYCTERVQEDGQKLWCNWVWDKRGLRAKPRTQRGAA